MYGQVNKIVAVDGKRDELALHLLSAFATARGCLSLVVSLDEEAADTLWLTEVWAAKTDHAASIFDPDVNDAIGKSIPLIVSWEGIATTRPIGGVGLPSFTSSAPLAQDGGPEVTGSVSSY